ncbi:MAG: class I SAM-dependent methyltransferase [Pseudomonadota bacterium]
MREDERRDVSTPAADPRLPVLKATDERPSGGAMQQAKIAWTTTDTVLVGNHKVARAPAGTPSGVLGSGIRRDSARQLAFKKLMWPAAKLYEYLFIDGFIEQETSKLIAKYIRPNDVFLEIGCGNMELRNALGDDMVFNALDIELSEFHLRRVLDSDQRVNVVLASATDIPAASESVSLIVSTEVLREIPHVDHAFAEIRRVSKPGGRFICSISNGHCHKYKAKGQHPSAIHTWSFDEFVSFAEDHGLRLLEGSRKGVWVPLPTWLTRTSYQLPVTAKSDYYNTVFFFAFEVA